VVFGVHWPGEKADGEFKRSGGREAELLYTIDQLIGSAAI
jgi:hypothetical protein